MQQEVEIARAISSNARLLILDEATSSLSEAATQRLLAVVEEQRAAGVAVLMISHRMPELYAAASLRDGAARRQPRRHVPPPGDQRAAARLDDGRPRARRLLRQAPARQGRGDARGDGVATQNGALRPTSLRVHRGEILGVAGLVGSGKAELGMALGGAIPCTGSVRVNGKEVAMGDPRSTLSGGIGFVPDDRKRSALLPTRSVSENFSIAWNGHLSNKGVLDTRAERRMVRDAITRYGVITASAASRITTLSGGNQQKVVLGRMFALGVEVLVLSEPTRGIDVGAKSEIYRLMQEAAAQGAAIVLISSELPELLGIADRIVVFYGGEVRGEFSGRGMQEEDIAHVAVTGASMAPDQQTIMETS